MTDLDENARVWELIDKIGFCMLTTQISGSLRARPMAAHPEPIDNAIYFLTDVAGHKDEEIARWPDVCLAFADTKGQKYVSISGTAEIANDRMAQEVQILHDHRALQTQAAAQFLDLAVRRSQRQEKHRRVAEHARHDKDDRHDTPDGEQRLTDADEEVSRHGPYFRTTSEARTQSSPRAFHSIRAEVA